jgi:hypothetical protein
MVAPRALAWAAEARHPAARTRLPDMTARVSHAALAANDPEGRCAIGPSVQSANTVCRLAEGGEPDIVLSRERDEIARDVRIAEITRFSHPPTLFRWRDKSAQVRGWHEAAAHWYRDPHPERRSYVADVAGGQGMLTRILRKRFGFETEVIDPRGWALKGEDPLPVLAPATGLG